MIVAFLFLSAFVQLYWLYRLMKKSDEYERRIKAIEDRKPELEKRVNISTIQQLYSPIENFAPKKPETLRPNQVRGREVDQNVFEFDSKL